MNTTKKNRINPANKQPLRSPTQSLFKNNRACSINFSGLALGNFIGGRGEDLAYHEQRPSIMGSISCRFKKFTKFSFYPVSILSSILLSLGKDITACKGRKEWK